MDHKYTDQKTSPELFGTNSEFGTASEIFFSKKKEKNSILQKNYQQKSTALTSAVFFNESRIVNRNIKIKVIMPRITEI